MTDKLTRRDWFRLKGPQRSSQVLGNNTSATDESNLQPIAHPPNHDGLDLSELPPMVEAILVDDQIRSLFADISKLADEVLLMQRTRGSSRATSRKADAREKLATAEVALLSGAIERLQIRYKWQGVQWIDTLESKDSGYRLVRIAHG